MSKKCLKCKTTFDPSISLSGKIVYKLDYRKYCSWKCANSRTKNRKEINIKISKGIRKRYPEHLDVIKKVCLFCKKEFLLKWGKRDNILCSFKCRCLYRSNQLLGKKFKSGKERKPGSGGFREKGGRQKYLSYKSEIAGLLILNKDEIRVAKVLDGLRLNWRRNRRGFPYKSKENKDRKYYPDFYIIDLDIYIEYKGWCNEEMTHKMNDATKRNDLNLCIIFSEKYKSMGLSIDKLEDKPKILFVHIEKFSKKK